MKFTSKNRCTWFDNSSIKKKKGSIRWSKTFDARKAFLNQCTTADPAAISKIMSKFGRSWG
ncbi:hypothetical protein CR538_26090 (plasmid) [Escherichia coli]|uniref:Conjugal transfer protein n=1 Tax=Escherichia coli TaxID=562 RepID=A0AAN1MAB3_ECOLX|nr:hypothetical protein CR538_26090 [Escherichia coli]